MSELGKKHFAPLKLEGQSGARARDHRLSKHAALPTAHPPPTPLNVRDPYQLVLSN